MNNKETMPTITLLHSKGLPIAENSVTQIFSYPDAYEFLANGNSFKLKKEKVTDISITTDIELQKTSVSSIGGAIGGGIVFGSIGAAIGGRSKEKTSRIINSYLVFTFLDYNEIKYLAFNCTGNLKANKFIKEFNKFNKNNSIKSIEL